MKSKKLLQQLVFPAFILVLSPLSHADSVCLYARSSSDPMSGHAFVTVQSGDVVIESYGFWPKSKNPEMLAINQVAKGREGIKKYGDLPFAWLKSKRISVEDKTLSEDWLCMEMGRVDLNRTRKIALDYINQYGGYRSLANNCTHFAIRQFNAITGYNFKVVISPLAAKKVMSDIDAQNDAPAN